MPIPPLVFVLGSAGLLLGGFMYNELGHGDMADAMGLGHRHMMDVGGYHCDGSMDNATWARHIEHMHGNGNATMPHAGCPAQHDQMHQGDRMRHMGGA